MKPLEYLLNQLSEEMCEVGQVVSKINRFGIESVKPGEELTNRQKLVEELNDVYATIELLKEYLEEDGRGGLPGLGDRPFVEKRIGKILHFAEVSRELGNLTDENGELPKV